MRDIMRAHCSQRGWVLLLCFLPWLESAAPAPTQRLLHPPSLPPPAIFPSPGVSTRRPTSHEEVGRQASGVLFLATIWFMVGYGRQRQRWWHRLTVRPSPPAAPATGLAGKPRAIISNRSEASDTLAVRVESSNNAGSFEVSKDLVNSYEDLRHCIVDALPDMFGEEDADLRMTFEYRRANGSWAQSKKSKPFEKLKVAGSVMVRLVDASSYSMGARPGWSAGRQSQYGKVRVVNCSIDGAVL